MVRFVWTIRLEFVYFIDSGRFVANTRKIGLHGLKIEKIGIAFLQILSDEDKRLEVRY